MGGQPVVGYLLGLASGLGIAAAGLLALRPRRRTERRYASPDLLHEIDRLNARLRDLDADDAPEPLRSGGDLL